MVSDHQTFEIVLRYVCLGLPVAWMISSNATEDTIGFFLGHMRSLFPEIIPAEFMADMDPGQLNAIRRNYSPSRPLWCWWHVLHAWQSHFVVTHFPELWDTLKKWIRMEDKVEFEATWTKIQSIAPPSVVEYLETYYIPTQSLWSAVYRRGRSVFTEGDTNMLVEAYVA
jgi:hypothetical protein